MVSIIHNLRDKFDIGEINNIFTSVAMENTPPKFLINFTSGVFSGETLVFI